jgi:GNAT superfamily N-acetyltransferase
MTRHEPVPELKSPVDCSKEERDHFRDIILEAGEVEETGLDNRIARAEALVLLRLGAATIGVGALKIPNKDYARKLFSRANAKNEPSAFGLEIGWIVVERAYRGHFFSRQIVEALVARADGRRIYATSVSTRIPMHKAPAACGFVRDGVDWQSQRRPDEKLFLFVYNGHSGVVGVPENLRVLGH